MADNSLGAKTGVPVVLPNISEVTAYTPVIAGVTTSATAAYYQIVGSVMNVWGSFTMTTYASAFGIPMPGAYLIDTAKVPRGATLNYSIGTANYEDVSTGFQYYGTCWPTSTTNVQIHGNSGTADTWGSASKPVAAGSGDIVNFWFQVPVAGLSASLAYGAGLATSVRSGLTPATATLGKVRVATGNGYGSTNTMIRRFSTTIDSVGSDITYADSATLGGSFTINTSGIYSISYNDRFSVGSSIGISKNSASLTTNIVLISQAQRLIFTSCSAANITATIPLTSYFAAGDVLRAHGDGATEGSSPDLTSFTIQRLA